MVHFKQLMALIALVIMSQATWAQNIDLKHLASYTTGAEGNAETVTYNPEKKYAYYTSAANNSFSIVDISKPSTPVLVKEISLETWGAGPNSIDYNGEILAVAVENANKQANGNIVFFTEEGEYKAHLEAGALPDMLTFTPDGEYLLVANEGEPSDDYTVDPMGSITVIDAGGEATTVTFESYNDKKQSLINKGVRIFGNNGQASVAQDLEPEYITVSADSKTAYVNCQENNAIVVFDIEKKEVVDILPLGYKDHSTGSPSIALHKLNEKVAEWPALGTPTYGGGQPTVMLGGFSGMYYDADASTDEKSVFYAIPDRGPNDGAVKKATTTPVAPQNLRPFKLPNYQARMVKFTLDHASGAISLDEQIMLTRKDGTTPISGRGNIAGFDEVPVVIAHTAERSLFEDDFTANNLDKWSAISLASDKDWKVKKYQDKYFAAMNGFGGDAASNDYLIAGPFAADANTILSFATAKKYTGGALNVLVSSSYDGGAKPNDAEWTNLNDKAKFSEGDYNIVESGDINLGDFAGKEVYIAFHYVSSGTGAGEAAAWQVYDVKLTSKVDYASVDYTDADGKEYHVLPYDEMGGDFEGILKDKDGNFWMCDEYRPAIYKMDPSGKMIDRYVPQGTSMLGTEAQAVGTYGNETLPAVYAKRRANRGFEAIAYDKESHTIYAFIQSPLYNPDKGTKNNSDVIRILGINAETGAPVSEYLYFLERNKDKGYAAARVDKIGDAVYTGGGKFLVIERDSEGPDNESGKKYIYEINLIGATNVLGRETDKELEAMTIDEIYALGIRGVHKHKVVNLPSIGYESSDKAEGVALLPDGSIAVLNDNDFGLAGAGITDNSVLGIISFGTNYGFDASNKDDAINIKNQPTLGMFQPDAIASYDVDGMTYIVTANEGDARDYDGYSEEVRVSKLKLDSVAYPQAETLQEKANLGRLKTTTATGDYDGDGDIDQIYSYGARSFSIFDKYGNIVFDSGDIFGQKTAELEPELFNEDDGEKDGRSDDKGVEPEAVAVGTIGDNVYAFVGLERQSAIIVYDITDPRAPKFITYYNNRTWEDGKVTGDVSPEIIKFISAAKSPNEKDMLLVGYEVSGSMAMIQVGNLTSISETVKDASFSVYPNPVVRGNIVNFDTPITGTVYTIDGKVIRHIEEATSIDTDAFDSGIYLVDSDKGMQRFVVLR